MTQIGSKPQKACRVAFGGNNFMKTSSMSSCSGDCGSGHGEPTQHATSQSCLDDRANLDPENWGCHRNSGLHQSIGGYLLGWPSQTNLGLKISLVTFLAGALVGGSSKLMNCKAFAVQSAQGLRMSVIDSEGEHKHNQ